MRIISFILGLSLLVAACTGTESAPQSTSSTIAPTTTVAETDRADCLTGELPFVEGGVVAALDSQGPDAAAIGDVRWIPSDACERIEVTFLSDVGSPASSIGPVVVSILPDSGIVRVVFSEDIADTAVTDATLEGTLADRWFVVNGLSDGLVLDVHLGERAAARAFSTTSPARLVIDVIPTDDERPITPPAIDGGVVVLSPQPGVGLYPLQIAGYAAPEIDAIRIRLIEQTDVAFDRSISTLSSVFAWYAFGTTLDDGPSGSVDLFVGTVDENGDPIAGVDAPLDLP